MNNDFDWLLNQAKDKKTIRLLNQIKKDYILIRKTKNVIKDGSIIKLRLGKYLIFLKRNVAPSSIDIYKEIFKNNKHTIPKSFNGKNDFLILDIGANEGFYTLKMKGRNLSTKIIAIEPNPIAFKLLTKNIIKNNLKDVILINKAVTSKNGLINFQIVKEITPICSLKITKRIWLDKSRIRTIKVNSITLEHLINQFSIKTIDILKLDAEGCEFDILSKSKPLLNRIKKIVVEYHSNAIKSKLINLLTKSRFKLIYHDKESKTCGDLYFINQSAENRSHKL
jgi:FkbM family methyltransferase